MKADLEGMSREELLGALRALVKEKEAAAEHEKGTARLMHELQAHQIELELQNHELREAQAALELSRDRFQELYDLAPIAYFMFDAHGVVQEVNLTGATLVGRERARVVGRPFLDLVHAQAPAVFWGHLARCAAEGRPVTSEMRLFTPRLGDRDVQIASAPVLGGDGRAVAFRSSLTDITPRKQAEAALEQARRLEERLHRAFEALDRASTALSRALARAGGPDRKELLQTIADQARAIARSEYALMTTGGDPGTPFSAAAWSGLDPAKAALLGAPPRARGVLGEVLRAGRALRLADLRLHPAFEGFPRGHPEMRGFLGVPVRSGERVMGHLFLANGRRGDELSQEQQWLVELFAERAGIALEIAQLDEEVRAAVRARDDVLAIVSHDLRNPLSAIQLSASQLARGLAGDAAGEHGSPERSRKRIEVILRSSERMARLIGDLLDVATIEAGTFTVCAHPEQVLPILDEVLRAHEPLAAARSIHLQCDTPPELPPVLCDRQRLFQVFANLIGNAVKFVHEGGEVAVSARVEAGEVRFEVADDGPGIPADQAARLFERYWKGRREAREGVGLGLFIARGIVEAHGGRLGIESAPGRGSTFHFTIPVAGDREPTTRPPPPA